MSQALADRRKTGGKLKRLFDCVAEKVSMEKRIQLLAEYNQRNPFAARMWPRWTGVPFDGTEAGLRLVAEHFPSVALRPPASEKDAA